MLTLASLYLSGLGMITILAFFARHNQKTGWKKQRKYLVMDLLEYGGRMDAEPVPSAPAQSVGLTTEYAGADVQRSPVSAPEALDFSMQLVNLRSALGQTVSVASVSESLRSEEEVYVERSGPAKH